MGSYLPLTFNLKSEVNNNIERKNIKNKLGDFDGTSWGYKTTDRGLKTIFTKKDNTITINSDWVSEYMGGFIEDMLESTDVYVWDEESGIYRSIIIKTSSWKTKTRVNDKLINYTIDFEWANKNRSRIG